RRRIWRARISDASRRPLDRYRRHSPTSAHDPRRGHQNRRCDPRGRNVIRDGEAPTTVRTIVVDDEPLARAGVLSLLAQDPNIDVIGQCSSGEDAIAMIRETAPQLVLLDIQMPGLTGFDVVAAIDGPDAPVFVFLTAHDEFALGAFAAHVADY